MERTTSIRTVTLAALAASALVACGPTGLDR